MSQGPLSRLFQSWSHVPAPAPGFGSEVWTRIGARQHVGWPGRLALFNELHRWLMPACLAALIILGLTAGVLTGINAGRSAERERLAHVFASNTDPFLMIASNHATPGHPHR